MKLKQRQKELQSDLLDRIRELDELKKSLKGTHVQELEVHMGG